MDWITAALVGALVLAAAALLYEGRGLVFYYDEWDFVLGRRGNNADAFLAPHGEHPSLVPVLVWKALWTVFGTAHYLPYRLAVIALHLLICALLFVVARRRVGAPAALVATVLVAFFGPGFEDLLWPFQVGFLAPVACWLVILLALDRDDVRGDVLVAVALTVALFSSGTGAPVAAGAAVFVLLRGNLRRALCVLAPPAALFAMWSLLYGQRGGLDIGGLVSAPQLVLDSASATLAALIGLNWNWGKPLAYGFLALIVWRLTRPARPSPRLLAVLAALLAYWGLQGVFRPGSATPPPSHYLYPGAVFSLLVLFELAPRRLPWPAPRTIAVVAMLTAAAGAGNLVALRDGAIRFRTTSEFVAAEMGALALLRDRVDPGFQPEPAFAPQIQAGPWFAAVDRSPLPVDSPAQLTRRPDVVRRATDVVLLRAQAARLAPAALPTAPGPTPAAERSSGGSASVADGCLRWRPRGPRAWLEIAVPPDGVVLQATGAPASVLARRFGDGYALPGEPPAYPIYKPWDVPLEAFASAPRLALAGGATARLALAPAGWHARFAGSAQLTVCAA